jgi:hypothetical protein
MKAKSLKLILLILVSLSAVALAACTPETLQIGIEPTPAPSPTPTPTWQRYENQGYGFSFGYPATWTLTEVPNAVELRQGTLALRIGFRAAAESVDISAGRTGMPAGDFVYGDKVFFLGQAIPAQVLQYEGKAKMVLYDTSVLEQSDLTFSIVLEDVDNADYLALDIPETALAEVKQILESFQRFQPSEPTSPLTPSPSATPTPAAELATYTNDEYGFAFDYPTGWGIVNTESRVVQLQRGATFVHIGFKYLFESVDIWAGRELPAGDPVQMGTMDFSGQALERIVIQSEGEDRAVYYGGAPSMITAGDLEFSIFARATTAIPVEDQAQIDAMVESFRLPAPAWPKEDENLAIGWYGSVKSLPAGSQFDDYLALEPDGMAQIGLTGASPAVESQIIALRDKEPPSANAHFWGTFTCNVPDHGGCQLVVTHLRPDGPGPLPAPDPVVGWEGIILTNSAWPQIDDALILNGRFPIYYGIWSEDATIAAQIEEMRNTGVWVRVWGQLLCGIMDANGCQIQVNRLESDGLGESIQAQPTDVKYVQAQADVTMYTGPSADYPIIGMVYDGQAALVTGISPDGRWWQVICPDDKVGGCWITADPEMTEPTSPPTGQ